MTLAQALAGSDAPPEILALQVLVDVPYRGHGGAMRRGQLVVARDLAPEIEQIFWEIYDSRFPIHSIQPIVSFGWSDDESMDANNSSAFNYRAKIGKSVLSAHAQGRAVDINPRCNPYINGDLTLPPGALYKPGARGTILPSGEVVAAFERRGWKWGGRWTKLLDYHHFEKP